jgi:hypothetical protein
MKISDEVTRSLLIVDDLTEDNGFVNASIQILSDDGGQVIILSESQINTLVKYLSNCGHVSLDSGFKGE